MRHLPDLRDADIHDTLTAFYHTIEGDPLLAPYFAGLDMPAHMPRIEAFWSTLLFHTGRYSGNAFKPHLEMPGLTAEHFSRWVAALEATVDARFAGPVAQRMKELGHRIAYSMQLRLGIAPFTELRELSEPVGLQALEKNERKLVPEHQLGARAGAQVTVHSPPFPLYPNADNSSPPTAGSEA